MVRLNINLLKKFQNKMEKTSNKNLKQLRNNLNQTVKQTNQLNNQKNSKLNLILMEKHNNPLLPNQISSQNKHKTLYRIKQQILTEKLHLLFKNQIIQMVKLMILKLLLFQIFQLQTLTEKQILIIKQESMVMNFIMTRKKKIMVY